MVVGNIDKATGTRDIDQLYGLKSVIERGISHLAEIFVPLLPAIITGGLILGFRNVIGDIKMFDPTVIHSFPRPVIRRGCEAEAWANSHFEDKADS